MHTVYNMHKINQEILRYKTDQSLPTACLQYGRWNYCERATYVRNFVVHYAVDSVKKSL